MEKTIQELLDLSKLALENNDLESFNTIQELLKSLILTSIIQGENS
jgi:hypothetical protein